MDLSDDFFTFDPPPALGTLLADTFCLLIEEVSILRQFRDLVKI